MTTNEDAWSGTVAKKSRALLDGSNLYRRLEIRLDDGTHVDVKVDRDLWKQLEVGDRLVKEEGEKPHRVPHRV
ncbi:hypothetical protein B0E53_04541 [Micromonospora sp. MH33]|uniref:DUF7489 domain-containing protein n=1 Tax=Micromonospora sp. MH33 TaxID=1945509 RepID=UPI000D14B179|nr:hypothetical protein [Micromonospora sp. MH33]PSK63534.1 hypothetical protein B0E53_04541 [Micromonospora sp. MH33]